jgi:Predicted Zn peptidase
VVSLASDDPIAEVIARARAMVLEGMDRGWQGPPFDPMALAQLLGMDVSVNTAVRDARTVPMARGKLRIEFNPDRPPGRRRYSVAHELAHTLFPDVGDAIRYRHMQDEMHGDEWQLEALCNIAAAELLMPIASFATPSAEELTMHYVLEQQRKFDVSTEALVIRLVETSADSLAAFCASPISTARGRRYQLDYAIGSRAWPNRIPPKLRLPSETVVAQCTAVGFSAIGTERWSNQLAQARVEAVGIPPYPGGDAPRVVGFLTIPRDNPNEAERPHLQSVIGDALQPRGSGNQIVVQVVNDKTPNWGGGGFASAVRRRFPQVQEDFRGWAQHQGTKLKLGSVRFSRVDDRLMVGSIVAQHGYGPSAKPRLKYSALREGLWSVGKTACVRNASVHMPRIGAGQAGGSWDVISDLVQETLLDQGVSVTVYDPPGRTIATPSQTSLELF